MKILWIEDDDRFLSVHYRALEAEGFQVEQIRTGSEAIRELQDRGQKYNLIILDIILPPGEENLFPEELQDEERGIEILRELADRGVASLPPIMFLTARSPEISFEQLHEELPYELVAMFGKPINVEQLIRVVKQHVRR